MYFRTSDKMKIPDKLAIRRGVGGGGGWGGQISATELNNKFDICGKFYQRVEHLS